jgi:single-strand DNA-binding protein
MVNKVILIGNVGADPAIRYLEGGIPVANLSIATTESYKNKNGERVDQTEWHNIVLWRGLAQIVEAYVKKGMLLYIEGRLRTRSWDDQNGVKRYTTEIYADTMQMLSRKREDSAAHVQGGSPVPTAATTPTQSPVSDSPVTSADGADDDLPF